jgi:N-acylmannosamine kinase
LRLQRFAMVLQERIELTRGRFGERREFSASAWYIADIGQVVIDDEGSPCGCGGRSCIERNASGTAIAACASEEYNETINAQEVFRRASRGDRLGSDILNRATRQILCILIDCIAMLDLDCVVVGGGVGLAAGFIDRTSGEVDMASETFRRPMLAARFGADAGLIGVARLASERKFHP